MTSAATDTLGTLADASARPAAASRATVPDVVKEFCKFDIVFWNVLHDSEPGIINMFRWNMRQCSISSDCLCNFLIFFIFQCEAYCLDFSPYTLAEMKRTS